MIVPRISDFCSTLRPSPKRSPTPKRQAPSPPKPWASTSSANATPIVTSSRREVNYDSEEFGASGRKKRLAALAAKFSNYDADDPTVADDNAVAGRGQFIA